MSYIYKGTEPIKYHDDILVDLGDVFDINQFRIINISKQNKTNKITPEIYQDILINSEEYDGSGDLDNDIENESDQYDIIKKREFLIWNLDTIKRLIDYGVLRKDQFDCRGYNIGQSNYSKHIIQPWAIWQDYKLNPWDADIVKRALRTKKEEGMCENESRIQDYKKIIHICEERIRQLS